jgi:hypothetical protein
MQFEILKNNIWNLTYWNLKIEILKFEIPWNF